MPSFLTKPRKKRNSELTVGDLIQYLTENFNPNAGVYMGEENIAMLGAKGYWQNITERQLPMIFRRAADEKRLIKDRDDLSEERKKEYLESDFIYVNGDGDLLMGF